MLLVLLGVLPKSAMVRSARFTRAVVVAGLAAMAILFLVPSRAAAQAPEQDEEGGPRAREQWFYHQRAYPLAHTPAGARTRALAQKRAMQQREAAAASQSAAISNASWTLIGPQPTVNGEGSFWSTTSGRVNAIAVDTTDSTGNTLYIGGAEGGVWKTSNGGANWTPLTDNQFSLAIGSIAIDPNNHLSVYVGTGEENFNGDAYYGGGLLKSSDGGTSWTQLGQAYFGGPLQSEFGGSYIGAIAIQPGVSSGTPVVLVASQYSSGSQSFSSGIWRSTDGGNSWALVLPTSGDITAFGTSLLFVSNTTVYAAIGSLAGDSSNGVYKSTNAGQTWTAANGSGSTALITGMNAGRITLVAAPSGPTTLYASIASNVESSPGLAGMFKSADGGATWNAIATPLGTGGNGSTNDFCGTQCWYDMSMAVSPTNPSLLYVGGSFNYNAGNGGIYMTTNGGSNWSSVNPGTMTSEGIHPDFHAIAFAPGPKLYVGDDGGMWSTTQVGTTNLAWTNLNATLAITQFYPGLSIYVGGANLALDGTQDNGTQLYSGSTWTTVTCGDGAWSALDPTTSNNMWSGCTPGNDYVERSTNSGLFWNDASRGINTGDPVAFIPPLVMDPKNPSTLYFGTNHVWQTTNGASPSWTSISPDLTSSSPFGDYITAIAVSPASSTNLFAGTSNNLVWFSTNTGGTWTQITSGLPPRYPAMVQGDPQTATTFYVTFSGFSGFADNLGHVFKCSTTTATCLDISSNLPNTPANDIVIDPAVSNAYYLATDIGVFSTTSGGASWSTFSNGLPNVAVVGLKLHAASRTLRAVTHGRSAWDISLSNTQTLQALTLTLGGNGTGTVSSNPAGVDCPSTCSVGFNTGTVVNLVPAASAGSVFSGWSGACSGTGSCAVTMSAAQSATAIFNQAGSAFPLSVTLAGSGSGAVTSNPTGISCPGTCSANFSNDASVALTATAATGSAFVGWGGACSGAGSCSVTMDSAQSVTATFATTSALRFVPLTPCRVVDTRNANGPLGGPAIAAKTSRNFPIPSSSCLAGVPADVAAYSLNVTVSPAAGALGYLTIWPTGQSQPLVSTLNSYDGRVKANAAIVPAGTSGAVSVYATDTTHVVLDINGYFLPANDPAAPLAFFPLTPCRLVDTRSPSGPLGGPSLAAQEIRSFPVQSASCSIPTTAQAYSLNFTVVPSVPLGYLTTWPTGTSQPLVSTLNAPTGTVTANAAIVPAGNQANAGAISAYVTNDTDLIIDINGYFAPSTSPSDLSFYPVPSCRIVDTRQTTGAFSGTIEEDMTAGGCGVPTSGAAVVLNATVVPEITLGYLTLWPAGQTQPLASTLNAYDGYVTSNMAIVPISGGSIDAYATDLTQLILDTSGYFLSGIGPAPTSTTSTERH